MRIKINVSIKVGKVVKYLVISDLFLLFGWGIIDPIFPVFILDRILGATLFTLGAVSAVYWVVKSLLQIPVANYLDKQTGEKDDFMALVGGLMLAGFSALAFCVINRVWELYLVEALHAVGFALYIPSWSSLFSRHLDRDRISFDWSLDSTASGIAAGLSGLIAGAVAAAFGYNAIFIVGGIFSLLAAFVLITVPDLVLPRPAEVSVQMKDKTPTATGV